MSKLECRDIWKFYGDGRHRLAQQFPEGPPDPSTIGDLRERGLVPAVAGVSFNVGVGEIVVLMGLSGSGKSTLLRCIARLVDPTFGSIALDGEELTSMSSKALAEVRRHKMGMVFQNFGLFPHLSVLDNVGFPLRVQGVSVDERRKQALEMIVRVGLEGKEQAFPHELSGGQQQRVGIARSLASNPELWLLDEPFSALDPLIRRQLQNEFLRLQQDLKKTIVFVTHDMMEALRVGDRIAIMRDGRIVQMGTPEEIVLNPTDDYVASFTAEVPRYRVERIGSIMSTLPPGDISERSVVRLPFDTTVQDALKPIQESGLVHVTDVSGEVVGAVSAREIVGCLVSPAASGQ